MRKLITNFTNVPKIEIGPLAQNCLTSTVGNPHYPNAKALTDDLQAALAPYQGAVAVLHPTPTQTAELGQLRVALNQALGAVATMANGLYPDDEAALLSVGLSLSKERERHTTLEVPSKFQLVDGPQPGTLCVKAKRPPHSVALKYLYTLDASGTRWWCATATACSRPAKPPTACTARWPPWAATPTSSPTPTCSRAWCSRAGVVRRPATSHSKATLSFYYLLV